MDGQIFPDQPLKLIKEPSIPSMPVIIGNTLEETLPWADTAGKVTDEASYAAAIDKVFGAASREEILAQYPAKSYPTPRWPSRGSRPMPNSPAKAGGWRGRFQKCSVSRSIATFSRRLRKTIRR